MARDAAPTRDALITAAEQLFAAHGVGRVSLREINRSSGARNAVALQYHFKDRQGMVRAVLSKHSPGVEHHRHQLLDSYEAESTPSLRQLSAALVLPAAAKLSDRNGGPEYLQISAELLNRPTLQFEATRRSGAANSIDRWRDLVQPYLEKDAALLHRRFTAIRFSAVELGRRAQSGPHGDNRLFSSQLVDLVTALLLAPVSPQTGELAQERARRRSNARSVV